jgi:hypothetical protein
MDAMSRTTETAESYQSIVPEPYTRLVDWPAVKVADGTISSPMLDLLGRPSRDTSLESNRSSNLTARQTMFLLNSNEVERMIRDSGRLNRLNAQAHGGAIVLNRTIIEELYLAGLSRYPTPQEKEKIESLMNARQQQQTQQPQQQQQQQRQQQQRQQQQQQQQQDAARDLMWAILNSSEFVFNH